MNGLRPGARLRFVHWSCLPEPDLPLEEVGEKLQELAPLLGPESQPVEVGMELRVAVPAPDEGGTGSAHACLVCGSPARLGRNALGAVLAELAHGAREPWDLTRMIPMPLPEVAFRRLLASSED